MKLFNAQSAEKQVKNNETTTSENKALATKVLSDKDLLATVAGGINEIARPWPPVRPV
jgi:hypothetical protein